MPDSPLLNSQGVVRLAVTCNGEPLPDTAGIVTLTVRHAVGEVSSAQLVVCDGNMPDGSWPLADGALLVPGVAIVISAGYGNSDTPIFSGIVVKLGLRVAGDNDSHLVVECRDKAVKMTAGRRNANYIDQTDGDIMALLAGNHGLHHDIDATSEARATLLQHDCSDWDFLMSRAEFNGLLVTTDGGKLVVKAPAVTTAPALKVTWGEDLMEISADIDAQHQYSEVSAVAWDPAQQAVITQSAQAQQLNSQGNLSTATLAAVMSPSTLRLQSNAMLSSGDLGTWSKAQQVRTGLSRIRGTMKFQGSALARPAELIELAGMGARFNGEVFVSAVEHRIAEGHWISTVDFGMAPQGFTERRDVVAPAAAGVLPGVRGLHVGVVLKLDEDPRGEQRIQIKLPVMENATEGVWARLAHLQASSGFGTFFLPEVGDEVLVGFFGHDPSQPVVLGSLYSSRRAAPYTLEAANNTKAIVTRCKHKLEFDEDKKVITLSTPAANKVTLSDEGRSIVIEDQNGNKLTLDPSGITLKSPKDVTIDAQGSITLKAQGKVDISAQMDASMKGLNVSCEAQAGLVAKGQASAELSAGGQTTVRGAIVMIN